MSSKPSLNKASMYWGRPPQSLQTSANKQADFCGQSPAYFAHESGNLSQASGLDKSKSACAHNADALHLTEGRGCVPCPC